MDANPTRTVGTDWHSPADSANARRVGTLFYVQAAISRRAYLLGVATATAGVAAFLLAQLHAWPPHEDETLALFIGSKPLPDMFATVLGERGGAPLHFLLVHIAAWLSPTLTAVRLISVVFAVASIPVIAALLSRLAGRRLALVGTVLVAASWVLLFHGIYGRMYSLFLFTSALSFLALLRALDRRRPLDWGLWGLALLATLSCHQYGAFILGIEVVFAAVLWRRDRFPLVAPLVALAVVVAAAAPIWRSNLVLASRFDVGVGDGGTQLGGPLPVLEYLRSALGDFVAGWLAVFAIVVRPCRPRDLGARSRTAARSAAGRPGLPGTDPRVDAGASRRQRQRPRDPAPDLRAAVLQPARRGRPDLAHRPAPAPGRRRRWRSPSPRSARPRSPGAGRRRPRSTPASRSGGSRRARRPPAGLP